MKFPIITTVELIKSWQLKAFNKLLALLHLLKFKDYFSSHEERDFNVDTLS